MSAIIKKSVATAILALGISAISSASGESINAAINNQDAVNNQAMSMNDKGGDKGDKDDRGDKGDKDKGHDDDKDKGHKPPQCVPEPASMLALGIGAGVMAIRRRRAAK